MTRVTLPPHCILLSVGGNVKMKNCSREWKLLRGARKRYDIELFTGQAIVITFTLNYLPHLIVLQHLSGPLVML